MTKFVLVYTGGVPEGKEQQDAVMAEWGAWYGKMGEAIVDGGNPFGVSKYVTAKGVSDGSASSTPATGYTIISADSLDAAAAAVKDHPHLKYDGQIAVYEVFEI